MLKGFLFFCLLTTLVSAKEVVINEGDQSRMIFFMSRHQGVVKSNKKNFKRLIKRLNKDQIIGLELIVAAATKARVESRFGHTMLRFVDANGTAGDDIVLSFVADLDSPTLSSRRGIFGGYPVYPLLKSLRMFNRDYIKEDNRSLERYIIPTTKKMRLELINTLNKWWNELVLTQKTLDKEQSEKAKKKALKKANKIMGERKFDLVALQSEEAGLIYAWTIVETVGEDKKIHYVEPVKLKVAFSENFGKYKFLSNNCAGALTKFLKKVKFPSRGSLLWAGRVPVKIPIYFEKSLLNPLPKVTIPGLRALKEKLKLLLSLNDDGLDDSKKWPNDSLTILDSKLSVLEKMKVLDAISSIPRSVSKSLRSSLPPYRERPRYDQVYGLTTLQSNLYGVCSDDPCALEFNKSARAQWSEKEIQYKYSRHKKLLKKIAKGKLKKSLSTRPKIIEHYKYIFKKALRN